MRLGPEISADVGAETSQRVEGDRMWQSATGTAERRGLNHTTTGIVEQGMYARVTQEPWDGVSTLRGNAERYGKGTPSRSGVERSERAVGAMTWGNLLTGDPAEQRSAPENRLVGGKR
jgi:hypothetical protein